MRYLILSPSLFLQLTEKMRIGGRQRRRRRREGERAKEERNRRQEVAEVLRKIPIYAEGGHEKRPIYALVLPPLSPILTSFVSRQILRASLNASAQEFDSLQFNC